MRPEDDRIYTNGRLDGAAKPLLDIKSPARLWLGGWYNNYDFVGDLDEVRISRVARSADRIKLQFENQKPRQTLVGPLVQPGNEFSFSYVVHQPDRDSDRLKPEPRASAPRLINKPERGDSATFPTFW